MEHVIAELNYDNVSPGEAKTFKTRLAARAVVFDDNGKIAVIRTKDGYIKLPGGGIDDGEDVLTALKRECLEEIGVAVDDIEELGLVREVRRESALVQVSYAYGARAVGEKQKPQYTDEEKEKGFAPAWMDLDEAIAAIRKYGHTTELGRYVEARELAILSAAKSQWSYA